MRVVELLCMASLGACYAPTVPTGIACPEGVCPSGQTCIAGFCDGPGGGTDGAQDATTDGPVDGPIDALPPTWSVPTRVPSLSGDSNDWGPSISADSLTFYVNTDEPTPGEFTIYVASRATPTAPWGPLAEVPGVNLATNEYHADISIDGKELIYVSDLPPQGVRRMTRSATNQPWVGPQGLQLDGRESPGLFANDLRMIVSSSMIQEYARTSLDAPWTFQRNHVALDQHRLPGISADGLEIYTTRADELYRATRSSVDQPFGPPAIVSFGGPFDTYEYYDPELSADGRTLYLSIDTGAATDADIYITTR